LRPDPERPGSCASAAEPTPPTISIVDDDLSMRRALRRLVRSAGFPVETFASARDYLDATARDRGGCLVLDIYMEGMNGFELQERLVSDRCAIPVIFITAHDDPVTRERIRRSGAAGYLSKPFDPEALLDEIRRVSGAA
jgi:FixJ family two-component response regulator